MPEMMNDKGDGGGDSEEEEEGWGNAFYLPPPSRFIAQQAPPGTDSVHLACPSAAFPMLHVEIDNLDRSGVARLSDEQCSHIFEEGYRAHTSSVCSTGIGLDTTAKAIAAAGGTASMSVVRDAVDGRHAHDSSPLTAGRVCGGY